MYLFFFSCHGDLQDLHPFPTRRSSDLLPIERRSQILGMLAEGSSLRAASRLADVSIDRKSTRLNSSHGSISYAVFCLKKKNFPSGNFSSQSSRRALYASMLRTVTASPV